MTSDHLTIAGMAGALLCGAAYAATWLSPQFLWLASFGLLVNWFGDSLDGSLARVRQQERPRYGFFIDYTADVLSQIFIFFGLGASPYLHFDMACLAIISYWMASLFTLIRTVATEVFQLSFFGIGPTEIRIGLIAYNFLLLGFGEWSLETRFGKVSLLDGIMVVIFVAVFVTFLAMRRAEGQRLAAEDARR